MRIPIAIASCVLLIIAAALAPFAISGDNSTAADPTAAALAEISQLKVGKNDWPQFFGWSHRNNVPEGENIPAEFNVKEETNVLWKAELGSQSYGNAVVANGKVFVGTNNGHG